MTRTRFTSVTPAHVRRPARRRTTVWRPRVRHSQLLTATDAWLGLSAALSWSIGRLVDRNDLTVYTAPGAAGLLPARTNLVTGEIELDGALLGVPPDSVRPGLVRDHSRYAALWGALLHEVGHARHSRWITAVPASEARSAGYAAALLLEEARVEAALLRRRPGDRRWLRAAARLLRFTAPPEEVRTDPWHAGQAAAVVLGRVDAGVLNDRETRPLHRVLRDALGAETLGELRRLWRTAIATADGDTAAMLELGDAWCEVLEIGPDDIPDLDLDDDAVGPHPLLLAGRDQAYGAAGPGTIGEEDADAPGDGLHAGQGAPDGAHAWHLRPPTAAELAGARRLSRELRDAAYREAVPIPVASATPGGRLKVRQALTADAQRDLGLPPTARPWRIIQRRRPPEPELRVGICCDVSASMDAYFEPLASAAWMLAWGCRWSNGISATATFGTTARLVAGPGVARRQVQTFEPEDHTQDLDEAIHRLDAALGLDQDAGAARLLILVTDGEIAIGREEAERRLRLLEDTGCRVLILAPPEHVRLDAGYTVTLEDAADAPAAVLQAATSALRATAR